MEQLFKQVLQNNKTKGLVPVDTLLSNTCMYSSAKNKLQSMGYSLQKLSPKQISILFFALTDILFIVKGDDFYLATLSNNKLYELKNLNMLIPSESEQYFEKTQQLINNNTQQTINQYLQQNKFHLIKINTVESCKTSCTIANLSGMNPYPSLESETVYCLTNVSDWFNELNTELIKGSLKLTMDSGYELCTSYLQQKKGVCTGGYILTNDLSYNPVQLPIWKIQDYQPYSNNEFIQQLLNGVVEVNNQKLTLNRNILESYYGRKNYLKLESLGVRYRLCLEELLSSYQTYSVAGYINKYNLDIYTCETVNDLKRTLRDKINTLDKKNNSLISARVLGSYESIKAKHTSYYCSINLDKLDKHTIKVVENIKDVLPKTYEYYNISESLGYNKVEIKATSIDLAMKYGETEFKRQFGKPIKFCSLICEGSIIKGFKPYKISINIQRELCQNLMWGYSQNYNAYSKLIKEICNNNNIYVTDDYIKYLYVNNLARHEKHCGDLKLSFVISSLLDFLNTISIRVDAEKALISELTKIVLPKVVKEYKLVCEHPEKYSRVETTKGTYIQTKHANYKIGKDNNINKTVDLQYNGRFLCTKVLSI